MREMTPLVCGRYARVRRDKDDVWTFIQHDQPPGHNCRASGIEHRVDEGECRMIDLRLAFIYSSVSAYHEVHLTPNIPMDMASMTI